MLSNIRYHRLEGGWVCLLENNFGKIGVVAGLSTFVLLVVGIRNVLGQPIEILNFVAFSVFGLIIGIIMASILFYKLKIAFYMFSSFLLDCILETFEISS